MTVMAGPTRGSRLHVRRYGILSDRPPAWLLSHRVLVLGAIPALYAATLVVGIFVLLTPPRLSLALEVAPSGTASIGSIGTLLISGSESRSRTGAMVCPGYRSCGV